MTKLAEWLLVLGLAFSVWIPLALNTQNSEFLTQHHTLILSLPVIAVAVFGAYAATTVLYRVFTFNNCEDAAAELLKDIEDAKKDLKKLGYELIENTE